MRYELKETGVESENFPLPSLFPKCLMIFSVTIMAVATGIFFLFPEKLVQIFSTESAIVAIGKYTFPVISISFVFAGFTLENAY